MKLRAFSTVLVTAAALVVAPTASPTSHSYSAGHFVLSIDGGSVVLEGEGRLTGGNTLVLSGTATPELRSWARSGTLKNATLVEYDGPVVATYSIQNAWPIILGETISFVGDPVTRVLE